MSIVTQTSICNSALSKLGAERITSLEDDTKEGRLCKEQYEKIRDALLQSHPWNFASKRITIASDATPPAFEYSQRYQFPNNFMRLSRIGERWDHQDLDFEIEEDFILIDETSPLKIVYVTDFENVSKFTAKFITALSYKLAQLMAFELTGNGTLVGVMADNFALSFTTAASVDGQNRPTRKIQRSRLANARMNRDRRPPRGSDWA